MERIVFVLMKVIIAILFSVNMLAGHSQVAELKNFSLDSSGFNSFEKTLRVYFEETMSDYEQLLESNCLFGELPDRIDSLERIGYRLKYIYASFGSAENYYKRISTDSLRTEPLFDSVGLELLANIDRGCGDGIYFEGSIGERYYTFHSTQPTGLVREVSYYLIKEDEVIK